MKQIIGILIFIFLFSSFVFGQDKYPKFLPKVNIDQIWHSGETPEHSMAFDPLIDDIINQTNLDSLISYVRILSGEDSVVLNGTKVRIEHRISFQNDLAADYIRNQLEKYNLELYDQIYSEKGRNIYAIQSGYLNPEKQYIICAHYDAVDEYCADDNASGVAAVLEAARILSQYDFKYTLVYALWDEEEIGLWGSHFYASQASSEQTDIQGVLNIDMIGWDGNNDQLLDIHVRDIANSDSIASQIMITNSLYELALNPVLYNPGTSASDHSPFWTYGYGAVLLIEAYYGDDLNPYYHSSEDRIEKFDLTFFHRLSKLSIGTISTLVEITEDTFIVSIDPGQGVWSNNVEIGIKTLHTHFMENEEPPEVWLSQGAEILEVDSVHVENNTLLTAYFYIPEETSTGLWDIHVQSTSDGLLSKEDGYEILSSLSAMVKHPKNPRNFNLDQNYPNPFNPKTTIHYNLPITNDVELTIYNLRGQKVATLVSETKKAGRHQVEWDASGFASGLYYYQMRTSEGFIETRKMILLR